MIVPTPGELRDVGCWFSIMTPSMSNGSAHDLPMTPAELAELARRRAKKPFPFGFRAPEEFTP